MSAICMLWHNHLYALATRLVFSMLVWQSDAKQELSAVTIWFFVSLLLHDSLS